MKLVIVDDDTAILEVTQLLFEQRGWTVASYNEFPDFSVISSFTPDVLLVDFWMKGLSGRELILALQNDMELKKIPLVVMSAMQHIEQKVSNLRISKIIKKPFDIDDLVHTISTLASHI
jgi:DNA-binding response OmpR family regulator